jgi:hypothetical protein
MAVKFSQFNAGATVADIDFIVGYKSTDNVQIPIGLVTVNTTYSIATAQDGLNESLTLTGVGPASTDVITFTAGANITLTDDGAGNGFTIQAKGSVDGTGTANVLPKWSDADTLTDSILTETAAAGLFTDPYISVAGAGGGVSTQNLEITGFLLDSNGQKGAAGQLLSSTGTLTDWVDAPSGETYDLNSSTDGANVDVNLTSTSGADNSSVKLVPAGGLTISQTGDVITLDTSASGSGTVTSVGTTTTGIAALTLSGTVTTSGDLDLAKTGGTTGQYIDGAAGAWTTLPASNPGTVTNVDSAVTAIPGLTLVTTDQTTTPTVTLGLAASAGANEYLDGGTGQWTALPSAGGISRLVTTDTGDGTTLIFTDITGSLTLPASNPEFNIDIYISGVYQAKASYTYTTATNGTITFASGGAPPNGAAIEYVTTT